MEQAQYDVVVIGGGPGGYVAAIRCAQLGLKVALAEKQHLGGICLNWGCIPTKALLRSAEVARLLKHADEFGFEIKEVKPNLEAIVKRSRAVSTQLSNGIQHLMKKNKIQVFEAEAKLGKGTDVLLTMNANKEQLTLKAKNIILATGARARILPGLEPDLQAVWTYREAMVPDHLPKSILVIGSGAIGIEFASFYNALGVKVTVVEMMDRILPVEDEEISTLAKKSFEKQGMTLITGAKVNKINKLGSSVQVEIDQKGKMLSVDVDRVISAIGIVANTENLGLEGRAIQLDRGHVVVNEFLQTGEKNIYAIGDMVGAPWLAHKASHEGVICAEHIAGKKDVHPMKKDNIPGCTYCFPQIASVGLTEAAAKAKGYQVKVGRFPFMANGKAIALGETEGMVKTVFDQKTGELLGAHMIGAEVTELIQGFVIGKTLETTEQELMHTIFPHPTLSEMMHESILDAYGQVVHM